MSEYLTDFCNWGLRSLLSGGVVLLVGWLAVRLSPSARTRQRLAMLSIRLALLAPLLCLLPQWILLPQWASAITPVPLVMEEPSPVAESPGKALALPPEEALPPLEYDPPAQAVAETLPVQEAVVTEGTATAFDWRWLAVSGYLVVSGLMLLQLLRGHAILRRLWQTSRPLPARIEREWDLHGVDVRISDRLGSAVCFGFLRPCVLLPQSFAREAGESLGWVLSHELEHARQGDHRAAYWVALARAVYFVLPWFWLLRRDLRLAQEFLADSAAASLTAPEDYAEFLVAISTANPAHPHRAVPAALGVRASHSDLYRRVTMLLSPQGVSRRSSRFWSGVVSLGVMAVAVVTTGVGLSAAEDKEDVKPTKPVDPSKILPKPLPVLPDNARPNDVNDFQKKLTEMMQNGNHDPFEMMRMMEQMNKQMVEQLRQQVMQGNQFGGFQFQFPNLQAPGFGQGFPAKPAIREQYENRLKQFDEEIAKNADNADARNAIKKARDAYVEGMASELKKADEQAKKNPQPQADPFGGRIQILPAFPADPFMGGFGDLQRRPTRLGVQVEKPTPALVEQLELKADLGIVVSSVVAGSPAEKAGLKKNDILVKFDGKEIPSDPTIFTEMVSRLKGGEKYDAEVIRKGKRETIKGIELAQVRAPARGGAGNNFNQMKVQVTNGDVNIQAQGNGVTYRIAGTLEDGKLNPSNITIDDGESKEYPSLEKVPEKYRATVEKLFGQVGGSGGR